MAHHDLPGSDEPFHVLEKAGIHKVPARCDRALVSDMQKDGIFTNKAIVPTCRGRYGKSPDSLQEAIAMNACDPKTPEQTGIRQYFR
jgi:hypothetical protein